MRLFKILLSPWLIVLAALITAPAYAQVMRIEILRREPFAGGASFAAVGPYEIVAGRLYLEADPDDPANQRVHDLALAPRNARGKVEYSTEFFLLKPVDPARGNGRLLYDVLNRGHKLALGLFNGASVAELQDAGNGFLMRRGYSVLWSGWSGDVMEGGGRMSARLPVAREHGREITSTVYAEMESSLTQMYENRQSPGAGDATKIRKSLPLAWGDTLAYPAVSLDNRQARLTVRAARSEPAVEIARARWQFARWENGEILPDPASVYLEEGFAPGMLYELTYIAGNPRVAGLGLASVRDVVAFFRYDDTDAAGAPNPLTGAIEHAYGVGVSQSSRFLNHFLYEGFNSDRRGRIAFDGLIMYVGGAGKGLFNYRFAQTTRHGSQHEETLYPTDFFPFATVPQEDPVTGQRGDAFARARALGNLPKIYYIQTSTEYWARAASLLHTDVQGKKDLPVDPNVRIYLYSGAAHNAMAGGLAEHPLNRRKAAPMLRASLVTLDDWVSRGIEPPPSRYPRLDDGTLVELPQFVSAFPKLPAVHLPSRYYQPLRLDPGPRWQSQGVADHAPPLAGPTYHTLLPMVNSDGNELAGVRYPDIAVPLGAFTGWNIRTEESGAPGMLLRWQGSHFPFARTERERKENRDPRPSIAERYPTRDIYLGKIAEAALRLRSERFLLDEDMIEILESAAEQTLWD